MKVSICKSLSLYFRLTFAVFRNAKELNWTMAINNPPKQMDPNDVVVALISAGSVILEL
jgi:hypothetical protein